MVLAENLLTQGTPGYTEEGCRSILSCGVYALASARWLEDALNLVAGAKAVLLHLDGVIPKPRVSTSGAKDLAGL
jgi:hypothetical protein